MEHIADVDVKKIVDEEVNKYRGNQGKIGVAVGVVLGQRDVFSSFGLADRASAVAVTPETLFVIASVQKVFTSTLCASLIVQGRMNLDAQITDYLPASVKTDGSVIRQVTPRALTTMTAAMARDIKGQPANALYRDEPPSEQLLSFWTGFNPEGLIGAKALYSNVGVVTLGFATVGAAGTGFTELLANTITLPLEMPDTVVDISKFPPSRIAVGYTRQGKPVPESSRGVGLSSTARDMVRFLRANMFLLPQMPPGLVRAMALAQQPLFRNSATVSTGMNWYIDSAGSMTIIGKNGGNVGFSSWVGFSPQQQLGIALLSNGHPEPASLSLTAAGKRILQRLAGSSGEVAARSDELSPDQGDLVEDKEGE